MVSHTYAHVICNFICYHKYSSTCSKDTYTYTMKGANYTIHEPHTVQYGVTELCFWAKKKIN